MSILNKDVKMDDVETEAGPEPMSDIETGTGSEPLNDPDSRDGENQGGSDEKGNGEHTRYLPHSLNQSIHLLTLVLILSIQATSIYCFVSFRV